MSSEFANPLLDLPCGVELVDAGAQDDEHVDDLVDFITSVFDARPELNSTLEAVYVTHNHLDLALWPVS